MLPKFDSDSQRRTYLALTDEWQPARTLAEHAGIPIKGAGTALLALVAVDTRSAVTPGALSNTDDGERA